MSRSRLRFALHRQSNIKLNIMHVKVNVIVNDMVKRKVKVKVKVMIKIKV